MIGPINLPAKQYPEISMAEEMWPYIKVCKPTPEQLEQLKRAAECSENGRVVMIPTPEPQPLPRGPCVRHADNPKAAAFCRHCGAKLPAREGVWPYWVMGICWIIFVAVMIWHFTRQ